MNIPPIDPRSLIDVLLLVAAAPVAVAAAYLGGLAALSRVPSPPGPGARRLRFAVVVPAHDEASGIADTVRSIATMDWPRFLFRILVIADNCTDDTAERARAAGAEVIARDDPARRGKGFALALAFEVLATEGWADAVAVVDADSLVDPGLLQAFATRIDDQRASAIQARYAVRNPRASWRTRLMSIAFTLFHDVRSLARERLGLSTGLRGNGWCVTTDALRWVPYGAFSEVEDVEYGIRLGEAGVRVRYAHEASVSGEMPSAGSSARSQRLRWERGRRELASRRGARLLRQGLRERSELLLDLAADLLVPPLATLVGLTALGLAASFGLGARPGEWAFGVTGLLLGIYVLRGWWLSRTGARGLFDLALAPLYAAWKVTVGLSPARRRDWVRTTREAERRLPSAARAPPPEPLRAELGRAWAEATRRGCRSLAVVPASEGAPAHEVAEELARLARLQPHGRARVADVDSALRGEGTRHGGELRGELSILALPVARTGTRALPLALAADAILLVVELGACEIGRLRETQATLGPDRILGCITVERSRA